MNTSAKFEFILMNSLNVSIQKLDSWMGALDG